MKKTNDYVLAAFDKKDDLDFLNLWMKNEIELSEKRQKTIQWKRWKNASGTTKNNKELYQIN